MMIFLIIVQLFGRNYDWIKGYIIGIITPDMVYFNKSYRLTGLWTNLSVSCFEKTVLVIASKYLLSQWGMIGPLPSYNLSGCSQWKGMSDITFTGLH